MTRTRTVHGDVPTKTLGRVDYHEHLFQTTPLLPGDELTNEVESTEEATRLRASGFETVVDATPVGLGRRPMALARASRREWCLPTSIGTRTQGSAPNSPHAGPNWSTRGRPREVRAGSGIISCLASTVDAGFADAVLLGATSPERPGTCPTTECPASNASDDASSPASSRRSDRNARTTCSRTTPELAGDPRHLIAAGYARSHALHGRSYQVTQARCARTPARVAHRGSAYRRARGCR